MPTEHQQSLLFVCDIHIRRTEGLGAMETLLVDASRSTGQNVEPAIIDLITLYYTPAHALFADNSPSQSFPATCIFSTQIKSVNLFEFSILKKHLRLLWLQ